MLIAAKFASVCPCAIRLTLAAAANVLETGTNPENDIRRVRDGECTEMDLLAECLDGADEDRVDGWREYVDAVCLAAQATTLKITMSERRPLTIVKDEWPVIAQAGRHDGQVECLANREWYLCVREHADGRRIVYGWLYAGHGGMPAGWRGAEGGFLVPLVADGSPDDEGTIRAIRRVAGIIDDDAMGAECIADLPAEVLT